MSRAQLPKVGQEYGQAMIKHGAQLRVARVELVALAVELGNLGHDLTFEVLLLRLEVRLQLHELGREVVPL